MELDLTPGITFTVLLLALLGWGIASGVQYLKHRTQLFMVKEVRVTGLSYLSASRILELAGVQKGVPLFSVSPEEIARRVLENKYVRAVNVRRILPGTVLIAVRERQPVAYLVDRVGYMVDDTGIILRVPRTLKVDELPIITGATVAQLLKDRTPLYRVLQLIAIIQEVDPLMLNFISNFHIGKDGWPELILVDGGARVVLGKEQFYQRLYLISQFLKQQGIERKLRDIRRIDVTFDQRIIVEYKTQKG